MVHRAGRVGLGLVGAGDVGELGAVQDVEVVVRGVAACVAFCADGGAEDDEVLGDTWVCLLMKSQVLKGLGQGPSRRREITYWHG